MKTDRKPLLSGFQLFLNVCAWVSIATLASAGTLSNPLVDSYDVRVGTQTFSPLYQFTTNTMLVETAEAITNMGSDTIKMMLGEGYWSSYQIPQNNNITNLTELVQNDPSCRQVFNMPFHNYICWTYAFSPPVPDWDNGYTTTSYQQDDYNEFYNLTRYLLTNYNNSGKTFYLGHWEGDGYLKVNNWGTNAPAIWMTGFIAYLNNRQKAIDDAKAATTTVSNVNVFEYAECNRVRDAMDNGTNNNQRMINCVIPYVTNLDYVSYSSYDMQRLDSSDMTATMNYIESHLPTNKVSKIPGERVWIGEYGYANAGDTPAQQEPETRSYIRWLLNYGSQALPYILFWEMYDNETNSNGSYQYFYLISPSNTFAPCYYLHQRFINSARLLTAQFLENSNSLPAPSNFVAMTSPMLNAPLPAPVNLTIVDNPVTSMGNNWADLSGTLTQGVYGDNEASVWAYWGTSDGGTNPGNWQHSNFIGVNTNFNPKIFIAQVTNLATNTTYYYRFYTSNSSATAWAPASYEFSTAPALNPASFGSSMQITFSGYNRSTALYYFPLLVNLSTNLPGFSYSQFASPSGYDLRFTDASGQTLLNYEIDQWNTNGVSSVWVNVPCIAASTNYIMAYWGNSALTTEPPCITNGSTWSNFAAVFHLKQSALPYTDSTTLHTANTGVAPVMTTSGMVGNAEVFYGTNYLAPNGTINAGNNFSLSAWVKLDSAATNIQTIWANTEPGWNANGLAMFINTYNTADGRINLTSGDGTNGTTASSVANAVPVGGWHHVYASINRTSGIGNIYVDGVNCTSANTMESDFGTNSIFNLASFTNAGYCLNGTLDEARIELTSRPADWVWATWMNVISNAALASYGRVLLPAPTGLTVTTTNTQANLLWNSVNGATSYTILYGTTAGGPYTPVQTNTTPSGTVSGLHYGTTYYFVVTANDVNGSSPYSAQVAATPMPPMQTITPTAYSRAMKITFAGYNRATTVSNIPVLVELSSNISGFAYNQFMFPTGDDLRFADYHGNVLYHEIDQWNTNGISYIWVNVPYIAANTNFITAYWGNRSETNPATWTTNGLAWFDFLATFHLKEAAFPYLDSTTLHSATSGVKPTMTTSGMIGDAQTFNGTSDYIAPSGAVNLGNAFSLSAWVKLSTTASNIQTIWANTQSGWNANGVALFVNTYNTADGSVNFTGGDGVNGMSATTTPNAVPVGAWHHIYASVNRTVGSATIYVDGVNCTASTNVWPNLGNSSAFDLGTFANNVDYMNGSMDEARIEPTNNSADWVWTTWMNVVSNSILAHYSAVTLTKVLDQDAFTSSMQLTTSGYIHTTILTNFPLLINLSTAISGFAYSQFDSPLGYDLRFTDASGQIMLNYEIDTWNTNGTSSVWVNVPSISSFTNYIVAYWGNPTLTYPPSWTTNGATWTNFAAVFHLRESAFPYADSTTLHSASSGVAPAMTTSGKVGNAETFYGSTNYLAAAGAINLGNAFSLSGWVKLATGETNIQTLWANKAAGWNANGVALYVNSYNTSNGVISIETGDGVNGLTGTSTANAVTAGAWHYVYASVNRSAGTVAIYVDGANCTSSGTIWTNLGTNAVFNMGRFTNSSFYLDGTVDEARIETVARPADWVWAAWMNVASNSAFVSYPSVAAPNVIVPLPPPSVQQPYLQASLSANGLLFNWDDQETGFVLYSTASLIPPVQWTPVTGYTILKNGQILVFPPTNGQDTIFYRLQSQ